MTPRTDRHTAVQVDLAINIAASRGIYAGAIKLFQLGLPLELAHRVLLHPSRRRVRCK